MRAFIKNLVRNYFNDHRHEFGEDAHFSEFLIVEGTITKENSYRADVYGYIMYARGKRIRSSRRMRVQYYRCRGNDVKRLMISSWFANDVAFYSHIWPLCVNEFTTNLVPKCCASAEHITSTASMGALIFECVEGVQNWGYMCRLDYDHLALMAYRIGQFHGRVFETRARKGQQLSRVTNLRGISVRPNASQVIPTLQRCLELLRRDRSFMEKPGSVSGAEHLEKMITNLEDRLHKCQPLNPSCLVLCHRNYSQACGFFSYMRTFPAIHVKIGYWAKMDWCSLADDLVILMLVDADPRWDFNVKHLGLVEEYIAGLNAECPDEWVPSRGHIFLEILFRAPVALYALASRVDGLGERAIRSGRLETSVRWNDQSVVDVYKLMISNKFCLKS